MSGLEGLRALAGIGRDEERIGVRQRHDREGSLSLLAGDHDRRLTEIELGLATGLAERDEDLGRVEAMKPHVATDHENAAGVAVLVTKALEDAFGGVALFRGSGPVCFEDLVDHLEERTELRLAPRDVLSVAGRLGVLEDLLQGPVAEVVLPADRALRGALHEDSPADLVPHLHVGVHPFSRLLVPSWPRAWEEGGEQMGMVRCCRFRRSRTDQECCRFRRWFTMLTPTGKDVTGTDADQVVSHIYGSEAGDQVEATRN